jgi:ABC-type nitrate/sulfonate/bicarbonate transport system substrate-binding protein
MKQWPRRIGAAVVMGLAWAIVWAPLALLIGTMIIDPDNSMDEMWVVIGAYPGFLCAVILYAMVTTSDRGHGLGEVSLPRVAAWGALAGLIVGVLPFALGTQSPDNPPWLGAVVIGSVILLSAVSAVASALVARAGRKRELQRPAF